MENALIGRKRSVTNTNDKTSKQSHNKRPQLTTTGPPKLSFSFATPPTESIRPPPPPVADTIAECTEVGGYDTIDDSVVCVRKYVYRTNRDIHRELSDSATPNVVQYLDSEDCTTNSTRAWMSMKRYPKTMFEYLNEPPNDVPWFKWMQQIAHCLYTMHTMGYVHRDIKPTNILIGSREEGFDAFLGDFGNACTILGTPPKDDNGTAQSFPTWCIPPLLHKKHYNQPHDDWWAFGKLLYICLFRTTTLDTYRHGPQLQNNDAQPLHKHIASLESTLQSRNEDRKMFNAMSHCLLQSMTETDGATLQDPEEREATLVKDKADTLGQKVCACLAS